MNVACVVTKGSSHFPAMRDPDNLVTEFPLKVCVGGYSSANIALSLAERWTKRFNTTGKMIYS